MVRQGSTQGMEENSQNQLGPGNGHYQVVRGERKKKKSHALDRLGLDGPGLKSSREISFVIDLSHDDAIQPFISNPDRLFGEEKMPPAF